MIIILKVAKMVMKATVYNFVIRQHLKRSTFWRKCFGQRTQVKNVCMYRYVPPRRVRFLRRFGLKTGIHFAHFGLESGLFFEGTRECMNVFIVSIQNE